MGGGSSKLHPAVEAELLASTRFDGPELRKWYHTFIQANPSGLLSREQFVKQNMEFTRFGDEFFWKHAFDVIDKDGNGEISFVEWCMLLSCINRGSMEEQLNLLFSVYDLDSSGTLEKDEITKILEFLNGLQPLSRSPEEIAEEVFSQLDAYPNDGVISFAEFVQGFSQYPSIKHSLNVLDEVFQGFKERHVKTEQSRLVNADGSQ